MLHPIFSVVLGRPELIADHVTNYAALARQEAQQTTRTLLARLIAGVLAAASTMLALGLTGMAVMLGVLHQDFHWVLVIVPGVAVVIALVAAYVAARPAGHDNFAELRAQFDADLRALHAVGEHRGQ